MWFGFARNLCRLFCKIFFRVRVYGKENVPEQGAFLLISNHQSFLDPVFCGIPLKRQMYFLARDSLFKKKFFGWLLSSVNTIPVRRGQADINAMKNATINDPEYKGRIDYNIYTPGKLEPGQNYFWRIDAVNNEGINKGEIWNFYVEEK